MIKQPQLGLVLKRFYPQKQALSILFAEHGKTTIITDPVWLGQRLWPGSIIACLPEDLQKKVAIAHEIELLAMPLEQDASSIAWLHQLLELCYYLLPPMSPEPELFSMLYKSFSFFSKTNLTDEALIALRALCRGALMARLDFYPEPWLVPGIKLFEKSLCESVDFALPPAVDWQQQIQPWSSEWQLARIDAWITYSLARHPLGHLVRTDAGFSGHPRKEAKDALHKTQP